MGGMWRRYAAGVVVSALLLAGCGGAPPPEVEVVPVQPAAGPVPADLPPDDWCKLGAWLDFAPDVTGHATPEAAVAALLAWFEARRASLAGRPYELLSDPSDLEVEPMVALLQRLLDPQERKVDVEGVQGRLERWWVEDRHGEVGDVTVSSGWPGWVVEAYSVRVPAEVCARAMASLGTPEPSPTGADGG